MPECDLDNDNDPLSLYLRKAPMVVSPKHAPSPTSTNTIRHECSTRDNKTDSISDVRRQRSKNINHAETDTENDKVGETEVSKQMD
jgi:predicted metal-dependent peptidase